MGNRSQYCVLCGERCCQEQPTVWTTTGEVVHIACADRQAIEVAALHQQHALVHLAIVVVYLFALLWGSGFTFRVALYVLLAWGVYFATHWRWLQRLAFRISIRWRYFNRWL